MSGKKKSVTGKYAKVAAKKKADRKASAKRAASKKVAAREAGLKKARKVRRLMAEGMSKYAARKKAGVKKKARKVRRLMASLPLARKPASRKKLARL